MRFWVAISKHGLRPIEKTGREFVEALPTAEPFEVEARLPADAAFDRHMGGVMDALAGALHTTADTVRAKLLIDTGNFTVVGKRDGNTVIAVSATSRSAITDPALRAFWDEAKVIIVNDMLPCIKDDAERHRVQELLSLEPA
jgi:hypothetical protein